MTVENEWGKSREFGFDEKPMITLKDSRSPRLVDLKVGFPVSVGYYERPDGTYIAQTIIRTDAPEVK